MTPAARLQAAIELLDQVLDGASAEQALARWARRARFAGSKDRAAIRDLVFQGLRCRSSYAALGGARSGRGIMLGHLRCVGKDPELLFTGATYAPDQLSILERNAGRAPEVPDKHDLAPWLWDAFCRSLGDQPAAQAAQMLRQRAPVTCRVNTRKTTVTDAQDILQADHISTERMDRASTALKIVDGARKLAQSRAFREGLVELQDTSSQAAMGSLVIPDGARVLDFCAGGGGKVLALAARCDAHWFAYDANRRRMTDLPNRANRAGAKVTLLDTPDLGKTGPFDLVLCDVPCSGSGTWRRNPDAKWRFTPDGLQKLLQTQRDILDTAQTLVAAGGRLVYSTCSVLEVENRVQADWFLQTHTRWTRSFQQVWPISENGDGFYITEFETA